MFFPASPSARSLIQVGVLLVSASQLHARSTPPQADLSKADAARQVRALYAQYDSIRAVAPLEARALQLCRQNCSAVVDPSTGTTAGQELNYAAARRLAETNRIADQIRNVVNTYILNSVHIDHPDLDKSRIPADLRDILGQASAGVPAAFVLRRSGKRTLVIFYGIATPFIGGSVASSAVLGAYAVEDGRLRFVGSVDCGMNGYLDLVPTQLPSPVPNEIWLLLAGKASAANGPNVRMCIVAYGERGFRMVWIPANAWGDFRVALIPGGFRIDGSYYRSARPRHDEYRLAADGVYRVDQRHP